MVSEIDQIAHTRLRRDGQRYTDNRRQLVQVLSDYPPPTVPVSLLYPRNRQLSPRVRVFIDYVMRAFGRV